MHTAGTACGNEMRKLRGSSARRDVDREAKMISLLVDMLRAPDRDTARAKFREFAALHAQRPAGFVEQMEARKGLRR